VARINDEHGELYPFAAETAVYQDETVKRAAIVAHQGKRILAIEYYPGSQNVNSEALKASLFWMHLDDVCVCRCIPVDKRHNAKVDYPALRRLLDDAL
jgi:hypothetical protein